MSPNSPRKNLVLLGAGRTHLQVLKGLAGQMPADTNVTLVAASPYYIEHAMLPGYVAGHYQLDDLRVPLDRLIEASGASFVPAQVQLLDVAAQRVQLSTGDALPYNVLSVDLEPELDRDWLDGIAPGARMNALLTRPLEAFVQLWPRVLGMAQEQALQVAVVARDIPGVELAMAAAHALAQPHGSRVTLVAGRTPVLEALARPLRKRVLTHLKRLHVTVLQDDCVGMEPGAVRLASGASLMCDAPIWVGGATLPQWLRRSGLETDDGGALRINNRLQSESHRQIFIAPAAALPDVARTLEANLRTALGGGSFKKAATGATHLRVVSCGSQQAVACWGPISLSGREVWHWGDRRARKQLAELVHI